MKLENVKVSGLEDSIVATRYGESDEDVSVKDLERIVLLTKSGELQWMTGVRVAFDLTCSTLVLADLEKDNSFEFVSCEPLLYKASNTEIKEQCLDSVDPRIMDITEGLKKQYNDILNIKPQNEEDAKNLEERKQKAYLRFLYSIPAGFELKARISTSYKSLLNLYLKEYNSELPEWKELCENILKLPYMRGLIKAYTQKDSV